MTEFGPKWPCEIRLYPAAPPEANITESDIELGGFSDISFCCKWIDATEFEVGATIWTQNLFRGGIEITNTLTIKGHLTDISLYAIEVVESIIGDVNLQIFNLLIGIISNILIIGFNAILGVGIYLPDYFPFLKPLELSEIDIYLSEYYLAIEALPIIDEDELMTQILN